MRSPMDKETYLRFYTNTVNSYSKKTQSFIIKQLESQNKITFKEQMSLGDTVDTVFFSSKHDIGRIIALTTGSEKFSNFYEKYEFSKLFKYSVPFFFECPEQKTLSDIFDSVGITVFNEDTYTSDYVLSTSLSEAKPLLLIEEDKYYVKFVVQRDYTLPGEETYEHIDYRYVIIIYFDVNKNVFEIRYDAAKYDDQFNADAYERQVRFCLDWIKYQLGLTVYICNHISTIDAVNNKENEDIKMYIQMMQLNSGASAELKAAEDEDYVIPFIGELRELIDENAEIFENAEEVKELLLQYLDDKEAKAKYTYIYTKRIKPVETLSYIVKITFDYFDSKYSLLQHITGKCKNYTSERMNDAIEYFCSIGAFTKGEKI